MKIYILSTYEEDGADDVKATSDPNKVTELIMSFTQFKDVHEEVSKAKEIMVEENNIGKHDLSNGWGGIQLHIVELT